MLEHGGNLRTAGAQFGQHDWLDLSTGINPHFYPAPVLAANAWHRLPEASPELAQAAAAFYGAALMLPVAGTQAAIQALPRLRAHLDGPARVTVAAPSYAEHAHHWQQHGHTLSQIAYADLESAIHHSDVVVICNPNNPTGATIPAATLLRWSEQLATHGGWLVVDEAFADTAPQHSVTAYSQQPGLIVLRSVGKFFGLAGIRLGFVAAAPAILEALADLLGPWTVSGPAQQIALAALGDQLWQDSMRQQLQSSGLRLQQMLAAHGICSHGTALFQWWPATEPEVFWQHMAQQGIWVRLFRHAARGIRLGLPPDEAGWQRLEAALTLWHQKEIA